MKIVSVFLMIALIFSIPSIALTQQNVEVAAAKVTKKQDAKFDDETLLAKEAAKRDAKNDTNRTSWFVGSFIGGGLIAAAGLSAGLEGVGGNPESLLFLLPGCGVCGGYVSAFLFGSPSPPSDRLLGKSPEYVTSYVNAYKDRVKEWQMISGIAGFALGFGGIAGIVLNFTDF